MTRTFAAVVVALLVPLAGVAAPPLTFTSLPGAPFAQVEGEEPLLAGPQAVAIDDAGEIVLADREGSLLWRIGRRGPPSIFPAESASTGGAAAPTPHLRFDAPSALLPAPGGGLFVAEAGSGRVLRVDSAGRTTMVAGGFTEPGSLAFDPAGILYVADTARGEVVAVSPSGQLRSLRLPAAISRPTALFRDAPNRWLLVADGPSGTLYRIDEDENPTLVASGLGEPAGIARGEDGTLYVSDRKGQVVRSIAPDGTVLLAAGSPGVAGRADGSLETARFSSPEGLAWDPARRVLLVVDRGNHDLRVGWPTLPDAAVVDVADGWSGQPRRLDTRPQTASSWEWQVVERPEGSFAGLSAATVRDPVFVPDLAGSYRIRLLARSPGGASVTFVDVVAACPSSLDNPGDRVACGGTATTFAATGVINATPKWQWRKDGSNIGPAKSQTYTIPSVASTDSGLYDVVLTDSCGQVTSPAARLVVGSFPPAAVGNTLRLAKSGANLALRWTDIPNVASTNPYQVFEDPLPAGGFTTVTGSASTGSTGLDVPLTATTRYYEVAGTNPCGAGAKGTCLPMTLTPATLPNPQLGIPYSQTFGQSGGTAPVSWTLGAGTLPPGLSLNASTGALTGTPTATGSYPFTTLATTAGGCSGWRYYPAVTTCPVYGVSTIPFAPIAGTGTAVSLTDESLSAALPVGFSFRFFCDVYTQFRICSNGFLTFNSTVPFLVFGQPIPTSAEPNNMVAMCWTDNDPGVGGTIEYFTTGVSPTRKLVVNFTGVPTLNENTTQTVQAILYETTNVVELHVTHVGYDYGFTYHPLTLGVEDLAGTQGTAATGLNSVYDSAVNTAFRFTPGG